MESAHVALAAQSSARSVLASFCVLLRCAVSVGFCEAFATFQRKVTTPMGPRHYRTDVNEPGCLALSHPASATPRYAKNNAEAYPPIARRTRSHALTRSTLSRAALTLCMPILFGFIPEALPTSDCAGAMERSQVAERAGELKRATLALEQALPEHQDDYALMIRVAWLLLLQERQQRCDHARVVLRVLDTTDGLARLATTISQCEKSAPVYGCDWTVLSGPMNASTVIELSSPDKIISSMRPLKVVASSHF